MKEYVVMMLIDDDMRHLKDAEEIQAYQRRLNELKTSIEEIGTLKNQWPGMWCASISQDNLVKHFGVKVEEFEETVNNVNRDSYKMKQVKLTGDPIVPDHLKDLGLQSLQISKARRAID